jgi:hypothetical protein
MIENGHHVAFLQEFKDKSKASFLRSRYNRAHHVTYLRCMDQGGASWAETKYPQVI